MNINNYTNIINNDNSNYLNNNSKSKFIKEAKSAAESFESVFIFEFLESMYSGVKLGDFGGGSSEKMYRSMLNEEISKSISKQGGIGISSEVFNEIIKSQGI
ncbi:MAG: hypothetical protein CFH01_01119 [Alphaproteobacteria bacterium MarineAlpha2_Bin1]|nr:MAG: hypothetical protein CFH01_01119 [Alphaproteobacteria bacterium MarineAlpha2_Bin1]|tara:strand:+ start:1482 stop:1787 length:306 start_codon:yes stop_codon:yes gene_type:complete